ncbi:MAG TPA: hypothetical protein VHJ18_25250 [Streptosporangiaceae bacterium]|jgi:hypothetical protein|nr:hypothetical protein [Streptosporangiaceae bacterium]
MIGVILASARPGSTRPGLAERIDLIKGGLRIRLGQRHYDGLDPGWRDTLAVATVIIPGMLAIVYAVIFSWTVHGQFTVQHNVHIAVTGVLAATVLIIALAPILAIRALRRLAIVVYFVPVLWLGYWGSAPVVSDENHGFFLAFLISAAAFVLSPGPCRAAQIMSVRTWAVVCGVGLALCVPEVMVRLAAWQRPAWIDRILFSPTAPRYGLVMVIALTLICAVAAVGLLRTLPPPLGRRLLLLLAVPAYPGALTLAADASGRVESVGTFAIVYLPAVLLACLCAGLVWRSRRPNQPSRTTPHSPRGPAD